ncbi:MULTISPECIES: peptidoglycan-binding domain-containing protein [Marinobacter]|uniref:peptidoglycan-binding domain-containing protein n=1 Tax=Marinobacter TaxID=2742 RepID=UPI0025C18368|nr:peptidoglycan-binding protein [Marinobacter sp.]
MTRSQSSRKPGVRSPVIAMLTAAAGLGTAQAAEPEKVIFAAENALYGAGHDIGRADGWIDEQLRTAIRAYQGKNGLQTNGNLDAATLEALGVTKTSSATIAANSVGSRKASMAKLGLSLPEPAPDSPAVARAEPKPEPEPAPQPVATPTRTPSEQVAQTPLPDIKTPDKQVATGDTLKQPEVTIEEKAPSEPQAPTPDPTPEPVVAEVTTPEVNEEPDPVLAQLPTEPTGAGYAEREATDTRKAQPIEEETTASTPTAAEKPHSTGGGFFSKLFDFFFGWLV